MALSAKLPTPRVLVPTMGALHEGHIALIRKARRLAGKNGSVMVSIFVNPIQFGPREDLAKYPRPRRQDLEICREAGVTLVFAPDARSVYAQDHSVYVDEMELGTGLCGEARPGHFRGVCTVVAKLFHILQPQMAVFGEKDWQQLAIIRRMVRDLNFPTKIVAYPTVREKDGLALSSRNKYLTIEQRSEAPEIRKALLEAGNSIASGETSLKRIITKIRQRLEKTGGEIGYVSIVHPETLQPIEKIENSALCAVAVRFGMTRLIDNIYLGK